MYIVSDWPKNMSEDPKTTGKLTTSAGDYCLTGTVYTCVFFPFALIAAYILTKIIYGSLYVHACPNSPIIPISLIVSGCLPLVVGGAAFGFGYKVKAEADAKEEKIDVYRYVILLLFIIMLLWNIVVSPLVTIERHLSFSRPQNATECSTNLLTFAFVTVIIDWVTVVLGLAALLFCWCFMELLRKLPW